MATPHDGQHSRRPRVVTGREREITPEQARRELERHRLPEPERGARQQEAKRDGTFHLARAVLEAIAAAGPDGSP